MNVSIELSPAIEKQLNEIAARYGIDVHEFAARCMQELIGGIGWTAENSAAVEQMLGNLASEMQANREQARAAQIQKNAAAIALLRSWREEDAKADEQTKARWEAEGKALEEGLAAHPFLLTSNDHDECGE